MTTNKFCDKQLMDEMLAELNLLEKTLQNGFVDVQNRWNTLRESYLGYGADEAEMQYSQLSTWVTSLEGTIDLLRNSHLCTDEPPVSQVSQQAVDEVNL